MNMAAVNISSVVFLHTCNLVPLVHTVEKMLHFSLVAFPVHPDSCKQTNRSKHEVIQTHTELLIGQFLATAIMHHQDPRGEIKFKCLHTKK